MTATVLHAQQLRRAFIKLMVADPVDVEPDQVHRLDGRLVMEEGGDER